MQFPVYVPAGARVHIERTLDGDGEGGQWKGILAFIKEYRANSHNGEAVKMLEREAECYRKFVDDSRMRAVYTELQKVVTDDRQYEYFLRAALHADVNFARHREKIKQANKLAPKIATAARNLAELLKAAGHVGSGHCPDEFFSIPELLDKTDNTDLDENTLYGWRTVRAEITGGTGTQESYALGYAWGKAPSLPTILETVAHAADGWQPQETGVIGVAIASRKRNRATEYVRAFASELQEDHHFILSGPMYAAIADAANVVLNDTAITPDAVRKAVILPPEDSS